MAFTKTPGLARLVGGEADPGLAARGVDADVRVVEAAAALRDLAVGRARVDAVVEAETRGARPARDRGAVLRQAGAGIGGRVRVGRLRRPARLERPLRTRRRSGRGVHRVVGLARVRRPDPSEEHAQRAVRHPQQVRVTHRRPPTERDRSRPDLASRADGDVGEFLLRPVLARVHEVEHAVRRPGESGLCEVDDRPRQPVHCPGGPAAALPASARTTATATTMTHGRHGRRAYRYSPSNAATESFARTGGRTSRHVHCFGSLSSRKRMSFVPWRNRFDCTLS